MRGGRKTTEIGECHAKSLSGCTRFHYRPEGAGAIRLVAAPQKSEISRARFGHGRRGSLPGGDPAYSGGRRSKVLPLDVPVPIYLDNAMRSIADGERAKYVRERPAGAGQSDEGEPESNLTNTLPDP